MKNKTTFYLNKINLKSERQIKNRSHEHCISQINVF